MCVSVIGGVDMRRYGGRFISILKRHRDTWWCGEGIRGGAGTRARCVRGIRENARICIHA